MELTHVWYMVHRLFRDPKRGINFSRRSMSASRLTVPITATRNNLDVAKRLPRSAIIIVP